MSEFKSTASDSGTNLHLAFEGTIDEDVEFPAVEPGRYSAITIDLGKVKAINSVGIREWLNWIRPLAENADFGLFFKLSINCVGSFAGSQSPG